MIISAQISTAQFFFFFFFSDGGTLIEEGPLCLVDFTGDCETISQQNHIANNAVKGERKHAMHIHTGKMEAH